MSDLGFEFREPPGGEYAVFDECQECLCGCPAGDDCTCLEGEPCNECRCMDHVLEEEDDD